MGSATESTGAMKLETVLHYGDRALMLEFGSAAEVLAWNDLLHTSNLPGVLDIVPASRTILLKLDGTKHLSPTRRRLSRLRLQTAAVQESIAGRNGPADLTIDVVYDGPDLPEVARLTGLKVAEVIAAHTGRPWRVGFGGFAPGFAYLIGGDQRLRVPRRAEPRTRVDTGSVGLAGEFSGVYPRESPGGWQLIGRTEAVLWDLGRAEPALLSPGMWIQFRAVDAAGDPSSAPRDVSPD